ncbi:MAG: hypothetical protein QOF70_7853 [Acetobacteraceae bacterium]|jgi:hypothetical protein|nr:hypothetical protein [Acetobacteraceae bacterium]
MTPSSRNAGRSKAIRMKMSTCFESHGEDNLHSTAIFFGFLIFVWGVHSLKLPLLIIRIPNDEDGPWESFLDRWARHFVAVAMLPVPAMLIVGGGALVRWGFLND